MPYIIYPQTNGQVAVIIPADPSMSIEEIATKDVPSGTPYAIVDSLNIENAFFNSYVFDQMLGAVLDFSKSQAQQNSGLNQLVYNESSHRAVKTFAGISNVLSDADWNALVATSRSAISSATTTDQLVAAIEPIQTAITANAAV